MVQNKGRRYLNLRGNKWWFKRDIPLALRPVFGRGTAYLVNLETSDLRVAISRRDELARETDRLFSDAKAGKAITRRGVQDEIRRLGEAWAVEFRESVEDPEKWQEKVAGRPIFEEGDYGASILTATGLVEDAAERVEREYGRAASERFLNIVYGHVDVDHHLPAYLNEAGLAPKTTKEREALVRRFAAWAVEKGYTMTDITRPVAGSYVTAFLVPMNRRTASKHLTALSQYWDYLRRRGCD